MFKKKKKKQRFNGQDHKQKVHPRTRAHPTTHPAIQIEVPSAQVVEERAPGGHRAPLPTQVLHPHYKRVPGVHNSWACLSLPLAKTFSGPGGQDCRAGAHLPLPPPFLSPHFRPCPQVPLPLYLELKEPKNSILKAGDGSESLPRV